MRITIEETIKKQGLVDYPNFVDDCQDIDQSCENIGHHP
jgi:hypothetical protein